MRDILLDTALRHYQAKRAEHLANLEVYLRNPVGVGEHSEIMEEVKRQIQEAAEANDAVELLEQFFELEDE